MWAVARAELRRPGLSAGGGVSMLALAEGLGGTGAGGMVLAFAEAGPDLPTAALTGDLGAAAGRVG